MFVFLSLLREVDHLFSILSCGLILFFFFFWKCLFKPSAHFYLFVYLFFFFFILCRNPLYIPNVSLLLVTYVANIFPRLFKAEVF